MNLSTLFIRRPVFTLVLMGAMLIFGGLAFFRLPVSELPDVEFPTITVRVTLAGADPETLASAVAAPLERAFSGLQGLDSMASTSATGSTRIVLQFALERSIDAAAQDVQSAISQTLRLLPPAIDPPEVRKENPSAAPVMHLVLRSRTVAFPLLDQFANDRVALRLAAVPGVGQIDVNGSQNYAVRLYVDPHALAARKLGFDQVVAAVQAANSNAPTGTLDGAARSYGVKADGQLHDAAAFDRLVLAWQSGQPVRLADVGHAEDSIENDKTSAYADGERALEINLHRQPGANTLAVTQRVRETLAEIRAQLPADAQLDMLYDRGDYIGASVHDVEWTLIGSLALVVAVILLFLRNASATLIVALVLPTSLVGTFGVMRLLGYSLDNVSLLALTLATGFVVDDAIVVVENTVRHLERGKPRGQAAIDAAREIGFTIASITLSLATVFLPIVFMGGLVGRLFAEFGVVIAVAVLLSGGVSLSLTPLLASRWLTARHSDFVLFRWFERGFAATEDAYARSLAWCIDRRGLMLVIGLAVLAGTALAYGRVDKGFVPQVDSGKIDGDTRVPSGTPYAEFVALQNRIAAIVRDHPDVAGVVSVVGTDSSLGNTGHLIIGLKPLAERRSSADDVIRQVRAQARTVQGIDFTMRNPAAIDMGPQATAAGLQYVLQSTDRDALYRAAEALTQRLAALPQLQDVDSDLQLRSPELRVDLRRDEAGALGITPAKLQDTLQSAFGGRRISNIYGSTDQYPVILQMERRLQSDPHALDALTLPGTSGEMVPLGAVADIRDAVGPLAVNHYGSLPSVTLSFNLAPGVALGAATRAVDAAAAGVLGDPAGARVSGRFAGTAQAFQDSLRDLPLLLLATVLLIYMILAVLYEDFLHPVTILTALPLAAFGALLLLGALHRELNLFSFVGLILLVGLVKKNGIMMVDFALELQRSGDIRFAEARAAMLEACQVRLRPIMMTTCAAILGSLPIALGAGAGADARRPLGIAVVGGLVCSQLLTLYLTPVFHVAVERLQTSRHSRAHGHPRPVGRSEHEVTHAAVDVSSGSRCTKASAQKVDEAAQLRRQMPVTRVHGEQRGREA